MVKWFLAGLCINAGIAVLQVIRLLPVNELDPKYFGLAGGYNSLALFLVVGILMGSYYFRRKTDFGHRLGILVMMGLFFFNIIVMRGRSGYFTFALLSPIVIYNLCNGKRLLIAFLSYLLLIEIMTLSPYVQERVVESYVDIKIRLNMDTERALGKRYTELEDRAYMWYWAVEIFRKNPILGVGTGGYHDAIKEEGGELAMAHPHNNILHIAVNFGIIGLIGFTWFFWVLLKRGWVNRGDPVGFFVFAGTLAVLAGGIADTHVLDAGPAFFLAVITGLQRALPLALSRRGKG
jgi:O-antigen ligase